MLALPEVFRGDAPDTKIIERCWEDFYRLFRKILFPTNFKIILEQKIRSHTQCAYESVKEYMVAILKLLKRHKGVEEAKLERIDTNIKPS